MAVAPTGLTGPQLAEWGNYNHLVEHNLRIGRLDEAAKYQRLRDAIVPANIPPPLPQGMAVGGIVPNLTQTPSASALFSQAMTEPGYISKFDAAPEYFQGGPPKDTSVTPVVSSPPAVNEAPATPWKPSIGDITDMPASRDDVPRTLAGESPDVIASYLDIHGLNAGRAWMQERNAWLDSQKTTTNTEEKTPSPDGDGQPPKTDGDGQPPPKDWKKHGWQRQQSGGPPVVDAPVHTGSPTPYAPTSVGGQEQEAFNAAIEEIATKLATTEDEMRKTQAVMVGLDQARIDTEQQQAAAAQQLQAIDVLSDPRASFFEQFSRAPRGTPIQIGPELSAVMRGQTIPSYGEIRHYTPGQPQLETIANDPESIRRAFEGAVGRLTTESIQNLSPRAIDQMSVLGQIGGYFPTDVFRAREAAIPKQPRLVRSLQLG